MLSCVILTVRLQRVGAKWLISCAPGVLLNYSSSSFFSSGASSDVLQTLWGAILVRSEHAPNSAGSVPRTAFRAGDHLDMRALVCAVRPEFS